MRLLGLDYGEKNIGVAISDELRLMAHGLEIIRKKSRLGFKLELKRISEIIEKYCIGIIVLGLPKNLDNSLGFQAEKTLRFKKELKEEILVREKRDKVEIILWDERLSSRFMEKSLSYMKVNSRKQKKIIDKMAAVFILQGYLDYINRK